MKKTISISTALLPEALRARFETQFAVVAKRSVVQWRLTASRDADVLLSETPLPAGRQVVIQVSDTPARAQGAEALDMPREFRVAALMVALDLAAVRVLDRRDTQVRAAAGAAHKPQAGNLYQLRYWVVPGDRMSMRFLRTLAGMTRRAVTRDWMVIEGGLSAEEADSLLHDLQLRGALRTTSQHLPGPPAPPAPAGFLTRLRRWLGGEPRAGGVLAVRP